jgi:hypothetical protein
MNDIQERKHIDETLRFIDDLSLPAMRPMGLLDTAGTPTVSNLLGNTVENDTAAVFGDSLVAMTAGLSNQNAEDVMSSLGLMEAASNKKYDRLTEAEQWYHFYQNRLTRLGWLTTSSAFQNYRPTSRSFTMDEIALAIIAQIGGAPFAAIALKALAALPKNEKALNLFENNSNSESLSTFKILPCLQTETGRVSMALSFLTFEKTVRNTKVLFFKYSSQDVNIRRGGDKLELNTQIFSGLRDQVNQKLDAAGRDFLEELEL